MPFPKPKLGGVRSASTELGEQLGNDGGAPLDESAGATSTLMGEAIDPGTSPLVCASCCPPFSAAFRGDLRFDTRFGSGHSRLPGVWCAGMRCPPPGGLAGAPPTSGCHGAMGWSPPSAMGRMAVSGRRPYGRCQQIAFFVPPDIGQFLYLHIGQFLYLTQVS